jgi:hypothetical protein
MKRFVWRVAPLFVGLSLLAVACAGGSGGSLGPAPSGSASPTVSPTGSPSGSPQPSGTPSSTPTGSPSPQPDFTFEVWFLSGGKLFVTHRTEPFVPAVAGLALDALVAGPNPAEEAAGLTSSVAPALDPTVTALSGGQATVSLGEILGFTDEEVREVEAQVVYTLTQYSTIQKVHLLGDTFARKDFEDLLPAILVESPLIGARVSSPVTVSGTANVFEATVSLRILDEDGNEIARTFTTATCGTGCRGDYSVAVSYSVDHEQPGIIEVFESSAQDGSMINVVDIPVTLTT